MSRHNIDTVSSTAVLRDTLFQVVLGGMAFFDYGTVLKKIPRYSVFHGIQLGKELIICFYSNC